jgi:hypothetical protein
MPVCAGARPLPSSLAHCAGLELPLVPGVKRAVPDGRRADRGTQADHTQLRQGDGVAVLPFLLLMQWQGGNVAQVNPAVEGTATSSRPSPTETAIEPSA